MWTGIAGVASLVFQCVIRALAHCILPHDDDKEGQDDQGAREMKDGRGTEHGFLAVERLDMVLDWFSF